MQRERRNRRKVQNHKLGIIVPYRDRPQQLKRFIKHMGEYLTDLDYQIFIIEQSDDKPFNRGKLLNVGYKFACDNGCDYFVFHDVDMLPEDVDYSYSDKPLHLATHLQEHDYETTFFDYFGGVTMFNKEDFELINGFSNEYWGWGFEDDDLLIRCIESDLEIDKECIQKEYDITEYESFKFNGTSSFIKIKSDDSKLLEDSFTLSVLVKPENILLNENKEYDEFPILVIPEYDIGFFYDSFRRFRCQIYDKNKKPYSITSDIIGESWLHLTMTYEDRKLSLYIDGKLYNTIITDDDLIEISSDIIFVGTSSDVKTNNNFFYGLISNVEAYEISLVKDEVYEIYKNSKYPKIRNFGKFYASEYLVNHILPENSNEEYCIDLSGNGKVELNDVGIIKLKNNQKTFLPKPYRRNSRFKSLVHKSNSSVGNKWIHGETRKNQLKYYNKIRQHEVDFRIDGLNTLRYKLVKEKENKKVKQISVEL